MKHVISPSEIVYLWVHNLIPDCQMKILTQLCLFYYTKKNGAIIFLFVQLLKEYVFQCQYAKPNTFHMKGVYL